MTAGFNTPIDGASNLSTGDVGCLAFNLDVGSEGERYLIQSMIAFLGLRHCHMQSMRHGLRNLGETAKK